MVFPKKFNCKLIETDVLINVNTFIICSLGLSKAFWFNLSETILVTAFKVIKGSGCGDIFNILATALIPSENSLLRTNLFFFKKTC